MMPSEDRQEPGAKHVPFVRGDAAVIGQGTLLNPRLVDPGGGKKLREKGQLRVRAGAGFVVPVNVYPTARRFHRK